MTCANKWEIFVIFLENPENLGRYTILEGIEEYTIDSRNENPPLYGREGEFFRYHVFS